MSESSDDETASLATGGTTTATLTIASSSNLSASNVIGGKQKSLFGGMGRFARFGCDRICWVGHQSDHKRAYTIVCLCECGHRVRHINHLREKWSGKPKAMPPICVVDATSSATAAVASSSYASSTMMALRKVKKLHVSNKLPNSSGSESDREQSDVEKRRRRTLSSMDMERYHTLSAWLEQNGIEIPQQYTHRRQVKMMYGTKVSGLASPVVAAPSAALGSSGRKSDLFDEVYDSLELLEKAVETEISQLSNSTPSLEQQLCHVDECKSSTAAPHQCNTNARKASSLVDYLVVIGPDVTDIAIQNYWHNEENVFEATVAFAWPPESQFNAESIEHFCFPSGVLVAQHGERCVFCQGTVLSFSARERANCLLPVIVNLKYEIGSSSKL